METSISRVYSEFSFHFVSVYQRLVQFYGWCMSRADPRVAKWPLMASPVPTLLIAMAYLTSVYYGRKFMAKRKPFSIRGILIPYNLAMALLNLYIGLELATTQHRKQYNWLCQPVNYSDDPDEIRIASALWWYYFSRLVEMMDTIFLVMRKKWQQLTFLHVYHHSTMFMLWWIGVKWVPGGSAFFAAMVNSFIHVAMYLYYALAACGPKVQKYLCWKKYLTILQMAQFVSALVLGLRALVYGCDFPLWMQYARVVYMSSFLFLFGQYYRNAYLQKKQHSQKKNR
uniref:Elongation of very long chain fatty acids protein n=1 Tax=Daphnia magna TaxID=35525 RepID=A0A0P4XV02_9CRUS